MVVTCAKKTEELNVKVTKRQDFVKRELKRIEEAKQAGNLQEAEERLGQLLDHYAKFTDLAELLRPYLPPPSTTPELSPAPAPAPPEVHAIPASPTS